MIGTIERTERSIDILRIAPWRATAAVQPLASGGRDVCTAAPLVNECASRVEGGTGTARAGAAATWALSLLPPTLSPTVGGGSGVGVGRVPGKERPVRGGRGSASIIASMLLPAPRPTKRETALGTALAAALGTALAATVVAVLVAAPPSKTLPLSSALPATPVALPATPVALPPLCAQLRPRLPPPLLPSAPPAAAAVAGGAATSGSDAEHAIGGLGTEAGTSAAVSSAAVGEADAAEADVVEADEGAEDATRSTRSTRSALSSLPGAPTTRPPAPARTVGSAAAVQTPASTPASTALSDNVCGP